MSFQELFHTFENENYEVNYLNANSFSVIRGVKIVKIVKKADNNYQISKGNLIQTLHYNNVFNIVKIILN